MDEINEKQRGIRTLNNSHKTENAVPLETTKGVKNSILKTFNIFSYDSVWAEHKILEQPPNNIIS